MLNLLVMAVTEPCFKELSHSIPWSIETSAFALFSTDLYSLGVERVPLCQRCLQIPSIAQTSMPNYDFFSPLVSIITFEEMTIKHLMYICEKYPFLTERGCGSTIYLSWNNDDSGLTRELYSVPSICQSDPFFDSIHSSFLFPIDEVTQGHGGNNERSKIINQHDIG